MNVALFFGSFNPIHIGHLIIANYVREFENFEQVWFVISPQNPFKVGQFLADKWQRYEMVNIATSEHKGFKPCKIEFDLPQPSYTYRTLEVLREKYPDYTFSLVMGGDNLPTFEKWRKATWIAENIEILVYPRKGFEYKQLEGYLNYWKNTAKSLRLINSPLVELSATFIRENLAQGKDLCYFLHPGVYKYIKQKKLYST